MIHSKNHKNGFTLVEVVLAMSIAALVLTPVFIMLSTIIQRVDRSSKAFNYILLCSNLLYQARQQQEPDAQTFSLDKAEIDFDATLTYSLEKGVDQKSSLASLQGLHKELVKVSWTEQDKKKQEQLITFVYKKPEQKKS
jgi:prepilin-type N-terminal cleavage/methylation domain-containing protein